jgi:peroxiredoxin Q/BCP
VAPGAPAPSFALPDQDGRTVRLDELRGGPVVLYFYPKDDTPGCTREACDFRDAQARLSAAGARVLGVSPDGPAQHARFASKHGLGFTLLADEPAPGGAPAVAERYGVWRQRTSFGRSGMGIVRTTFLIAADGRVARRWDAVKVEGHADEVLRAVEALAAARPGA